MTTLEEKSKAVSTNAYCRYSKFHVGAAIKTKSGKIFTGCNVENVSFGLTMCAERNAIGAMITAGESDPQEVVIYTPTDTPTLPCGACRQVLNEFNGKMKITSICDGKEVFNGTLDELLPHAFPVDALTD